LILVCSEIFVFYCFVPELCTQLLGCVATGSRSHYCIWSSPTMQSTIQGGSEAVRYLRKIEKVLQNSANLCTLKDRGLESTTRGRDPDVGCRHAPYTHAVLPYGIQLYPPRSCKHLACVYTLCVHCTYCVYTPAGTHQQLYISRFLLA
jgi:hypothetical protein